MDHTPAKPCARKQVMSMLNQLDIIQTMVCVTNLRHSYKHEEYDDTIEHDIADHIVCSLDVDVIIPSSPCRFSSRNPSSRYLSLSSRRLWRTCASLSSLRKCLSKRRRCTCYNSLVADVADVADVGMYAAAILTVQSVRVIRYSNHQHHGGKSHVLF